MEKRVFSFLEFINESNNIESNNLVKNCDELLKGFPIWENMKENIINSNTDLEIIEDPSLEVDAQFDADSSDSNRVIILINPSEKKDNQYKSTLAHELVHALQYLRDGKLDLFNNDITRELGILSDSSGWQKFLMAIYLSDPIEIEAKKAEMIWYNDKFTLEMANWMATFDSYKFEDYLLSLTPNQNEFDLEDFSELPDLWYSIYVNYQKDSNEPLSPEMEMLEGASLLEFIDFYSSKFKNYKKYLL